MRVIHTGGLRSTRVFLFFKKVYLAHANVVERPCYNFNNGNMFRKKIIQQEFPPASRRAQRSRKPQVPPRGQLFWFHHNLNFGFITGKFGPPENKATCPQGRMRTDSFRGRLCTRHSAVFKPRPIAPPCFMGPRIPRNQELRSDFVRSDLRRGCG